MNLVIWSRWLWGGAACAHSHGGGLGSPRLETSDSTSVFGDLNFQMDLLILASADP